MNFETFFNHKFLQRPEPPAQNPLTAGIQLLKEIMTNFLTSIYNIVDLPPPTIYGSPPVSGPVVAKVPIRSATPVKVATPPRSQPGR